MSVVPASISRRMFEGRIVSLVHDHCQSEVVLSGGREEGRREVSSRRRYQGKGKSRTLLAGSGRMKGTTRTRWIIARLSLRRKWGFWSAKGEMRGWPCSPSLCTRLLSKAPAGPREPKGESCARPERMVEFRGSSGCPGKSLRVTCSRTQRGLKGGKPRVARAARHAGPAVPPLYPHTTGPPSTPRSVRPLAAVGLALVGVLIRSVWSDGV